MDNVLLEIDGKLATVTINRPEVLNSLDYKTLDELDQVVADLHLNKDVHVVIFTGAGNKAFSAGADLKERRTLNEREVRRNVKKNQ